MHLPAALFGLLRTAVNIQLYIKTLILPLHLHFTSVIALVAEVTDMQNMNVISYGTLTFASYGGNIIHV